MGANGRQRYELRGFDEDSTSHGVLDRGRGERKIPVSRTAENDHLFRYDPTAKLFEVSHYGSCLIVSMLRLYERTEPGASVTADRALALFDINGRFYDRIFLESLSPKEADRGKANAKHTATFRTADEATEPLVIPIDDIYVFSLAKPADPMVEAPVVVAPTGLDVGQIP